VLLLKKFQICEQRDITYNLLAEHLISQVDSEGNKYRLLKEIISHQNNEVAAEKSDQWRPLESKKRSKQHQVRILRFSGTMEVLVELKPVGVANYAINN
jgi:hypothetical protein